ncbi:hypothetical protein OGAPHI_005405 [Ogataea philodendri]|uniref:Allantoate permease n=1 Tax=Ogataea philodendri TaxID=1378263 RepID=A0A9P8NZN5_9ASCO|nr:uncharacterized protein OGAPHI_005405 [Ogataea philodendri]KAH3662157.1 hypothetical protein OGAPHI_005405 [Ogataea philodendri]
MMVTSTMSSEKKLMNAVTSRVTVFSSDELNTHNLVTTITSANGGQVKVTNDVDMAMKLALEGDVDYDEKKDKALRWKIDLFLMPALMLLITALYMDKSALSTSAILGIKQSLDMKGDMYSWTSSAFYLGYLVFELPASFLLQRFPLAKTLSCFVILWSMILILHGAVKSYAGLMALRVILGMLESSINPGLMLITSQYYKVDEQFLRTSVWFCCSGIATILNNCIGYAMVQYEESYSVEPWRLNLYIIGAVSLGIGFFALAYLPDEPSKARFLNDEDKKRLVQRLRGNQQGFGSKRIKKNQIKEALTDVVTWYYFWYGVSSDIPSGAIGSFGSILLNDDFKFSTKKSMLMKMPTGAIIFPGNPLFVWACLKIWKSRMFVSVFSTIICIVAACMLAWPNGNNKVGLAGYYLQELNPISMIQCLSCFSSNTGGTTKKAVMDAIFLIGYCIGMVVGPQTFIESQAPDYIGGKIAIVVSYATSLIFLLLIWWEYDRRNRENAKHLREHPEIEEKARMVQNIEFADLTDKENPLFHYST